MSNRTPHRIRVIDSHTGGEPTRLVISGGPDLGSGPLTERLERLRTRYDDFRSAVVNEPRGSDVVVGALLCEPVDRTCVAGVIFFNNVGYLGMCGHGTIGLIATLAYMKRIRAGEHRVETPVGTVSAILHEDRTVTVNNVPSYRSATKVPVEVAGFGRVCGDVAWGGNWFFLVQDHNYELSLKNVELLTDFTWAVRQALKYGGIFGPNGEEIDHIELFGPSRLPGVNSRNFVLCPGKAYDRSPCGTGTSAKMACLYADGKLREGETWKQESIVGSLFEGTIKVRDGQVYPSIKGSAFVTAESDLIFDPCDPFAAGIRPVSARTYDVIVIGAGIVGAACAEACARQGMRVVVIERDVVGGGATAAAMGHIVVMDDSEAQFALTRYSQQLWQQLQKEFTPDVEYEQCGTIWIAADEEEMVEVRRKHEYYVQRGVPAEVLDAKTLELLEPNLRKDMVGGLLVPEDAVLQPPSAARLLIDRARRAGAEIHVGCAVTQIRSGRVWLANGNEFSGGSIVNAAGVWASALTPGLNIRKRKGHLALTDQHPGFVRHQLVELGYLKSAHSTTGDSVAFNVQPRKSGQILVGSSRQYGAEQSGVDTDILARMLQRAQEYLPGLAHMSTTKMWTGFRAATLDKLPLIGPMPGDPHLLLATGHEGLGITTSLGTAQLLVDQMTGGNPAIPVEPYLPSRASMERIGA